MSTDSLTDMDTQHRLGKKVVLRKGGEAEAQEEEEEALWSDTKDEEWDCVKEIVYERDRYQSVWLVKVAKWLSELLKK